MKENKNIDRLFQEKFKDFEAQPSDKVWAAIAAQQQKKKRVIPLWFKLSSAAAILVLLLLAGNFWFTGLKTTTTPHIVIEDNQERVEPSLNTKQEDSSKALHLKKAVAAQNKDEKSNSSSQAASALGKGKKVYREEATQERKGPSKVATSGNQQKSTHNPFVAQNDKTTTQLAENDKQETTASNTKNTSDEFNIREQKKYFNKNSAITEAQQNTEIKDSLPGKLVEDPNALEVLALGKNNDAMASSDEETTQEAKRWGISPLLAPVYYNSFSGSGIDPQFAGNSKSGDVNLSYGIQVSYAVNDKLTVRSGINKVDLGYSTNQVSFSPSISATSSINAISSIDYNENSEIIQLSNISKSTFASPNPNPVEFINANSMPTNSSLRQELGYIEIPVELEYSLINKKIGIQLIGGMSSLFLNSNAILLEEENNFVTELGKSNSLNSTSFSTNVGLGFDYKFTDRIQFNLEPMFKYQLNAYTKSVSDFKPYYLGLYTGVSIKF